MEDIDGGLHPAVDEQSQGETGKQQTDDNGRHWWRATSYSGWTKPRWKVKQESNRQKAMEDIDGGLHPAVDEQSQGETGKQQTDDNGRHWWRATSYSGWTKPRWKVKQESNKQRTMEDIDGGLHPAVDEQSQGETGKQQTDDNGRHWWRATSCSGWTKPRWKVKQESNRQRTMEDIDGGLHPAVDEQSQGETGKQQTDDNGRHWWRATSCSGWTKPRWKVKQESNRQRTMEDIDGGLHPAVDGQSLGERWNRKATDRGQWKALMEGYILQWMDKA